MLESAPLGSESLRKMEVLFGEVLKQLAPEEELLRIGSERFQNWVSLLCQNSSGRTRHQCICVYLRRYVDTYMSCTIVQLDTKSYNTVHGQSVPQAVPNLLKKPNVGKINL